MLSLIMAAQLLAAVVLCSALVAHSNGGETAPDARHQPPDAGAEITAAQGTPQHDAAGSGDSDRYSADPAARLDRVRSEAESLLGEGRHEPALRLIDDEQRRRTAPSDQLEALRNRILDDQRFRALWRKAETAFAQQQVRRAMILLRQAADMHQRAGSDVEHRVIAGQLAVYEAEQRYRHGRTAEARADLVDARWHYKAAVDATGHRAAAEALERMDRAEQRQALLEQGREAIDRGDHAVAIEHLRKAIVMGAGVEVSPLLAEAKLSLMLALSRQHSDADDLGTAVNAYKKVLRMHPANDEAIDALVALRRRHEYTRHLERGDALMAAERYVEAKTHYRRARAVMATDQIKHRLEDAEFDSLVTEVRRRLASSDLSGARALLQTALNTPAASRRAGKIRELTKRIGSLGR